MKAYRIHISSWTSGFRYPNIISGYQPTLLVPPISTVLGVINACAGAYVPHTTLTIGYYFDYEAKATDLETIYQVQLDSKDVPSNQVKPNVIRREFLFNSRLFIYLTDEQIVDYFRHPVYPVLLGRSSDLATIERIEEVELIEKEHATKIKGQVIPFNGNYLPGTIQALPTYFTDTIPRNNLGTKAYSVISYDSADVETHLTAYKDFIDNQEIDIYFQPLDFNLGNE